MAKTKTVTKKKSVAKPATKKAAATKKVETKKVAPAKKTVKKVTAVAPKKQVKAATKKVATKVVETAKKPTIAEKIQVAAKPKIAISKNIKHIAIAGNIGSGKTTLTQQLAKHYGWLPQFEDVENNPYLNDFYEDMPRWSFNLQVYFLNKRFKQIVEIQSGEEVVIQDRTIHEDAHIFAPNLHAMGLMSSRDFENYRSLFETVSGLIKPPDLLIYLKASVPTLVNQIQRRGREYEENLRLEYLRRLNEYYEKWITSYTDGKLLIIDVDKVNFADDKKALGEVISKIDAELYGLF
ncbi:MAG TPA: deoxynucleoside kinase [Chitinophagales bacterium]|nr:deoxynucleoside kinase [Chitinophagales bacterium]